MAVVVEVGLVARYVCSDLALPYALSTVSLKCPHFLGVGGRERYEGRGHSSLFFQRLLK